MSFYVKLRLTCRKRSCNKLSSYAKKIAKKKNECEALCRPAAFHSTMYSTYLYKSTLNAQSSACKDWQ